MTPEEREEACWLAIDEACEKFDMSLGVFVDLEGDAYPMLIESAALEPDRATH